MFRVFTRVSALVLCLSAFQSRPADAAGWVSGFYAGWDSSRYPPSAVDFSSLSHIMVFSVLPRANGTLDTTLFIDSVNGPLVAKDLAQRAHAAGRKAILTVGGMQTGAQFVGATSAANMGAFVQNLVNTVNAWGFDGLDIDWEPLNAADYGPMLALVGNLRAARPGMLITADVGWLNANFPLSASDAQFYTTLAGALDQMNMMTYQMADNWGGWVSWHSSATFGSGGNHPSSVSSSADGYLNAGVPAAKLGIGIGFYGSCWNAPVTAPLQSPGASHVVASDNTISFAAVKNQYYSDASYRYDSLAEAPYLSFPAATGPSGCTFISYEDETSVAAKGRYVQNTGLGGTIIWHLAEGYNSTAADPHSLLHAVGTAFLGGIVRDPPRRLPVLAAATAPQSTPEGRPFPAALKTRVIDQAGAPIAGLTVTFTTPSSGASATFGGLRTATAVTDASGIATAPAAQANTSPGSYSVAATVEGFTNSAAFALTNTAALPLAAKTVLGGPQTAYVNAVFAQPLQLTIVDAYANPVPGAQVSFIVFSSGVSVSFETGRVATVTTDANGIAVAPALTAGSRAGIYVVAAGATGLKQGAVYTLAVRKR